MLPVSYHLQTPISLLQTPISLLLALKLSTSHITYTPPTTYTSLTLGSIKGTENVSVILKT